MLVLLFRHCGISNYPMILRHVEYIGRSFSRVCERDCVTNIAGKVQVFAKSRGLFMGYVPVTALLFCFSRQTNCIAPRNIPGATLRLWCIVHARGFFIALCYVFFLVVTPKFCMEIEKGTILYENKVCVLFIDYQYILILPRD